MLVYNANDTWTAPVGITSVLVECWGGGGGGGNYFTQSGGGGGGGAFSKATVTVVPGNTYTIQVGTGGDTNGPYVNGGDTTFLDPGNNVLVKAVGGETATDDIPGEGGVFSSGVGTTRYSGGGGGLGGTGGSTSNGGGGGSSGGCAAHGTDGENGDDGGIGAPAPDVDSGAGGDGAVEPTQTSLAGDVPGGGGGGGSNSFPTGSVGAHGRMRLTF